MFSVKMFIGSALISLKIALSLGHAQAATISLTLPEFSSSFFDENESYPKPPVTVGTSSYTIPAGDRIVSANISGTFGNSDVPNSSAVNVLLDRLQVAQCTQSDACYLSESPTSWSFTFGSENFSLLADGSATLQATQTSEYVTNLGSTKLTIETVPEPLTILGSGLALGFGALMERQYSRKRKKTKQVG